MKHAIPDVATARRCIDALAEYLATKDDSPRAAADLRESVRLLSAQSLWQPIDSYYQQHRDGHSVLVAEGSVVVEAWYSNDHEVWWELNSVDDGAPGSDRRVNPTHWMPLPSPPQEQK